MNYKIKESAIELHALPKMLEHRTLLGRGSTSAVFEFNDTTIDMITRDRYKVEFMVEYLGFEKIDEFPYPHRRKEVEAFNIHHLRGERLYHTKNIKSLECLEEEHDQFCFNVLNRHDISQQHGLYLKSFTIEKNHPMRDAIDFKYGHKDSHNISIDVHHSNFMENRKGQLIGSDLILDIPLFNAING